MKILLPDDVSDIINTLIENGYEAYAVGGCVRDSIIHREPEDWDITTSARPNEVKELFKRTIDTGIEHGTVTVMIGKEGYEVTTYRVDGDYEDGRHPKSVEFTASLEEDLKRRDFTINAMAYNETKGIVDLYGGRTDIEAGIIRCVGEAEERFTEDALRMLRAVRFSAQLGYEVEEKTADAVRKLAPTIARISKERIHTELGKTLLSGHPEYINKACELGITSIVFSVYNELKNKKKALLILKNTPEDIAFRYAAIMYEHGRDRVIKQLKELKLDNATIDKTAMLVANYSLAISNDEIEVRKTASALGIENFRDILKFKRIFCEAGEKNVSDIDKTEELLNLFEARGDCISLKTLAINGADLIKEGIKPGREIGQLLKECLNAVLENPKINDKTILMEQIIKKHCV